MTGPTYSFVGPTLPVAPGSQGQAGRRAGQNGRHGFRPLLENARFGGFASALFASYGAPYDANRRLFTSSGGPDDASLRRPERRTTQVGGWFTLSGRPDDASCTAFYVVRREVRRKIWGQKVGQLAPRARKGTELGKEKTKIAGWRSSRPPESAEAANEPGPARRPRIRPHAQAVREGRVRTNGGSWRLIAAAKRIAHAVHVALLPPRRRWKCPSKARAPGGILNHCRKLAGGGALAPPFARAPSRAANPSAAPPASSSQWLPGSGTGEAEKKISSMTQ